MLKLPRKTMAALEAVLDIAHNARPEPVQSKEITARQNVPQRYLEQVMQQLVHAGILKGVRGPRGGYTLARERRRITIADLVRAVAAMDDEDEKEPPVASELGRLVLAPVWQEAQAEMMKRLEAVTLQDLCDRARKAGIATEKGDPVDFAI